MEIAGQAGNDGMKYTGMKYASMKYAVMPDLIGHLIK